jgi:hypothetical protein
MPEIKLAQNQDRTPVRLTICVSPELNDWLRDYAGFYEAAYGQPVALANLIPAMLASFLESDRGFVRHRREAAAGRTR